MSSEAVSYFVSSLSSVSEVPGTGTEPVRGAAGQVHGLCDQASADPALSDDDLLKALARSEKQALSTLFHRYARPVRNVAYKILRDEQEAEDVVQEVFLFLFRKASLFNPELGKASSWIIHVAYHRAFDRRRYLNSRHFYEACDLESTASRAVAAPPRTPSLGGGMQEMLGKTLMQRYQQRLSEGQRQVIELFFFGSHSFEEIAEIMGVSIVNVRSHYYRGLERLRRYVLPKDFGTQ